MKPSSPRFIKAPMGLHYSPNEFLERREKNQRSHHHDGSHYALRKVTLDWNNSASSQQLPRMQRQNVPWRQGTDQSRYYSDDSELDPVSVTSVSASEASTNKGHQDREQDWTFNCCLNQKITLSKLNDNSSTNDLWIWLVDAFQFIDSGCSMSALENDINRSLSNGFWGVWFHQN